MGLTSSAHGESNKGFTVADLSGGKKGHGSGVGSGSSGSRRYWWDHLVDTEDESSPGRIVLYRRMLDVIVLKD